MVSLCHGHSHTGGGTGGGSGEWGGIGAVAGDAVCGGAHGA
jgi:hypothetical protein